MASGSFGIDNSDIRYVTRARVADRDAVFGITLHNNPTVQDVWNTTPAWGYPFILSDVTPGSIAGTVIDGTLGQQVAGLGGYAMWDNLLYVEVTGYRTALQGLSPADSTATNAIQGVTPYWRVALQHQFGPVYGMIGTYGLVSHLYPTGVTGPTNRFTDVALDAQIERPFGGGGVVVARTTWINEQQALAASFGSGGRGPTRPHAQHRAGERDGRAERDVRRDAGLLLDNGDARLRALRAGGADWEPDRPADD